MARLFLLSALLLMLNACADAGLQRTTASQRLTFSQVSLDPESARTMINGYRSKKGLKPLTMNDKLTQAAKRHSADLARHDRIAHKGSDGTDPWDRVRKTGYKARLAAENVGAGQLSLAEVFKGWQDSPEHDKNLLLPDATHMGIALVQNPDTGFKTFWTLVLGSPL